MQCTKCKATWTYGPSDVCPTCWGKVQETPEASKDSKKGPDLSQTKSWWEFK